MHIISLILTLVIIGFVIYLFVDACKRVNDPDEWEDFLDNASIKRE